jgi:hypothetical protein
MKRVLDTKAPHLALSINLLVTTALRTSNDLCKLMTKIQQAISAFVTFALLVWFAQLIGTPLVGLNGILLFSRAYIFDICKINSWFCNFLEKGHCYQMFSTLLCRPQRKDFDQTDLSMLKCNHKSINQTFGCSKRAKCILILKINTEDLTKDCFEQS